jgi:phosphoribosylformylglycinamidine synthase II
VGGETVFDPTYQDNPLVNVFCLGLLPHDRLVLARASGPGNLAVLFGSSTGRDGIGGASVLASAGFGADGVDDDKRPSVQVGDPFEEKRLIEACLEILDAGLVVGIQDLGAAGITGAASETSSKGGVGMDVHLSEVHVREAGMEPFEVMTSESQERMLAIVEPAKLDDLLAVCTKWDIRASVIGTVTGTGRFRVLDRREGEVLADLPASSLDSDAPLYDRPRQEPATRAARTGDRSAPPAPADVGADLLDLLVDPTWVFRQYDHQLFLNTVEGPGGDATVLRLKHPTTGIDTGRGLALTCDGNHRWCALDPRRGTALVVAEAVMNLACVGGRPVGLVNCLNFGSPEHPEVMWQLVESIAGMGEACRAFGIPVVGGNVSLYNESQGQDIHPTPVVGLLGLVDRLDRRPPGVRLVAGGTLIALGPEPRSLSGSRWAWERGSQGGPGPDLDLEGHAAVAGLVRGLVAEGLLAGVHDTADGVGVALAEMAVRSGKGFRVQATGADHAWLFAESASRVVACVINGHADDVVRAAQSAGVAGRTLGRVTGDRLVVEGVLDVGVDAATAAWRGRLPASLGVGTSA